ncbi:hypothetical protein, partial [Pelagibacterium lacus]|uniref:hypothetical protein n=1 Tax=Pelagibacterium lacus TaxID=2282655 RepID=UPI001AEC787B
RWTTFKPPAAGQSSRYRGLILHRRSQSSRSFTAAAIANLQPFAMVNHDKLKPETPRESDSTGFGITSEMGRSLRLMTAVR